MTKRGSSLGFWGVVGFIVVISFIVTYWYIALGIGVVGGIVFWALSRNQKKAAAAAAEKTRQQQAEADTIAKIKAYKNLLDDGAITQDEYDRKKKDLLGDDWDKF